MKFEIDVDLPEAVLKEWEPVAFRVPHVGEMLWNEVARSVSRAGEKSHYAWIILRRRFQWPAWLKCRYLVWDHDGLASGWDKLPPCNCGEWNGDRFEYGCHFQAYGDTAKALGVSFPGGDWNKRIEENPNWEKNDDA